MNKDIYAERGCDAQHLRKSKVRTTLKERIVIALKSSKKALACICALIMATTSLAAYSVSAADESEQTTVSSQADTAESKVKTVKVGKVTAVNGSQLTVAMGDFSAKQSNAEKSSGDEETETAKKTRRSRKSESQSTDTQTESKPSSEAQPKSEATDSSDVQAFGEKTGRKHGRKCGKRGGRRGEFAENGTTETITITSDIVVKKKGETISVSDVNTDDIIKLKYDENNKLVEVKVSSKHKKNKSAEEKTAANSTTDSSKKYADESSNA